MRGRCSAHLVVTGRRARSTLQEGDSEIRLLDGSRGTLDGNATSYDIVVAKAEAWSCLNCGDRFEVLIAAKP